MVRCVLQAVGPVRDPAVPVTTWITAPDGLSRLPVDDDPFVGLEVAAAKFHISTGAIRELIQENVVRRKVVRLVEERWLVEHYIVSTVDLQAVFSTENPPVES